MSEQEINKRRNWKAETFSYDHYIPDSSEECSYCLTEKQVELLLGIIEPIGWRTRWWSDDDTPIDTDEIEAFRADIARRLMMSCCGDEAPNKFRYTEDGTLQMSTDNGGTWEDAPNFDPRNNSTVFPPPEISGESDAKCVAATSMAQAIKQQVSAQMTDDMTRYDIGELIKDWINTYIQTSNPFTALMTVVANQIFALVLSVLLPALTDDIYDLLQCIFFCNIADDISFSDGRVEAVRDQITSDIGGVAGVFLEHLVYLLGTVGMTNLARSQFSSTGDCDECGCGGCIDLWNWPTSSFGVNGTVLKDGVNNWISADAIFIGESYYWGFQSETCCSIQVTFTSGDANQFKGLIPCPDLPEYSFYVETNPPWTPAPLTITGNAFAVMARSTSPFTARVEFL